MGREVRRVPRGWEHPRDDRTGNYKPLHSWQRYATAAAHWLATLAEKGATPEGLQATIDWCGPPPDREDHMPAWSDAEATHLMMYENTSEGTPISPAFDTPEALARWLTDSGASSFGHLTSDYESWLRVCRGGWAPSAVMTIGPDGIGKIQSGVEALRKDEEL